MNKKIIISLGIITLFIISPFVLYAQDVTEEEFIEESSNENEDGLGEEFFEESSEIVDDEVLDDFELEEEDGSEMGEEGTTEDENDFSNYEYEAESPDNGTNDETMFEEESGTETESHMSSGEDNSYEQQLPTPTPPVNLTYIDYFYYVRARHGGTVPSDVVTDYNGDDVVDEKDKLIVLQALNPNYDPATITPSPGEEMDE